MIRKYVFSLRFCLFGGMSLSGSNEAPSPNQVLSKKKRRRAAYKGHLSKLEKDITMFLNEFVPGNLLHISNLEKDITMFLSEFVPGNLLPISNLEKDITMFLNEFVPGNFLHILKLEKDITMFLNEFIPENLLHILKLKLYKNKV